MRRAKELILNFLCENNLDVGYWNGQHLTCYRLTQDNILAEVPVDRATFNALDTQYTDDPTYVQMVDGLKATACPVIAALTPELKEQWKKEWAETGKGPGMTAFVLNALNPETGKKDGIQYTFGDSHVAQALACYANAVGKLGHIKHMVDQYENGLEVLSQLPAKLPVRNTLFRVWKAHWEALFQNVLEGKAKTYLFNLLATKYRTFLNESPAKVHAQ
jgi:hypothetical protein